MNRQGSCAHGSEHTRLNWTRYYYCVACHDEGGRAPGPVGRSYVPLPTSLRTQKIAEYGDGELLRAMRTGVGHEPVLGRVIRESHRWPLVVYLRQLGAERTKPGQ